MVLKKYFPGVVETSKTSQSTRPDLLYEMQQEFLPVSYTHLTLPTNREV